MSNTYPVHVERIRSVMASKGITQSELAAAVGLTQSGVSRRLSGAQSFRTDELLRIAEYLGCSLVIEIQDAA